jgi:hypothetical protein
MPISTFPRHDDYEDQFLLKPAGLRDTHSEGKVTLVLGNALMLFNGEALSRPKCRGKRADPRLEGSGRSGDDRVSPVRSDEVHKGSRIHLAQCFLGPLRDH